DAAATCARRGFGGVIGAAIVAIRGAVAIRVGIRDAAPTGARCDLGPLLRTTVEAISNAVSVAGPGRRAAAARPPPNPVRIIRTAVLTVGSPITVCVDRREDALPVHAAIRGARVAVVAADGDDNLNTGAADAIGARVSCPAIIRRRGGWTYRN